MSTHSNPSANALIGVSHFAGLSSGWHGFQGSRPRAACEHGGMKTVTGPALTNPVRKSKVRKSWLIKGIFRAFTVCTPLVLTACHQSAYVCPLSKQTGACASQWQAYQATRFYEADNDSIFNGTQNTDANDDEQSHAIAAASQKTNEKNKRPEKTGKINPNFLLTPAAVIER